MPEGDLKEKLGKIIKTHEMDPKKVSKEVNAYAPKIDGDKEETILRVVELAGKEKIEVINAFLLDRIRMKSNREMDEILTEFKKFVGKKEYASISSKPGREKLAAKAVKAQIAWEARVQSKQFEILVMGKSHPREINTKQGKNTIANVAAFCTPLEDDNIDPFYRSLSFWGDLGKKVKPLIIGHKYHCNLVRNRSVDSLDAWDPQDKTEFTEKGKFDGDVLKVLEDVNLQKIEIGEAEFNVSKSMADYRRIDCDIMGRQILTRGDNDIGILYVSDESSEDMIYGDEDGEVTGGFTVFADPQNLIYGEGSEVSLIGRIRKDDNGRISMNADAVIPILAIPVDMTPVDEEDEIDMKTGSKPVIDPDTLAEIDGSGDDLLVDEDDDDMFNPDGE